MVADAHTGFGRRGRTQGVRSRPRARMTRIWLRTVLAVELILLAALLAWRGAALETGSHEAPDAGEAGLRAAFDRALADEPDRAGWWSAELDAALDAGGTGQPDLALAASLLDAWPDIAGHDEETRADWRAANGTGGPEVPLSRGALDPDGLVFASEAQRERFAGAARLYGRVFAGAGSFFAGHETGSLDVAALPGLARADGAPAVLQGDLRDMLIHGCALIRRPDGPAPGCGTLDAVQTAEGDMTVFLLSYYAYAAHRGAIPAPAGAAEGARVLKAARVTGRMRPGLATWIETELDAEDADVLASLAPLFAEAEVAYAAPSRAGGQALDLAPRLLDVAPDGEMASLASDFGTIRRATSALIAIRVAEAVDAPEDAGRLAALARAGGGRLLALHHAAGPAMLEAPAAAPLPTLGPQTRRIGARIHILLAAACFAAALVLLLLPSGGRGKLA